MSLRQTLLIATSVSESYGSSNSWGSSRLSDRFGLSCTRSKARRNRSLLLFEMRSQLRGRVYGSRGRAWR
ncbi:hypothetical protein FOVSG1_013940 [Fusarium oxysporum f. sp. vasinfectum]